MVEDYQAPEIIERMAKAHEDGLIGGPADGYSLGTYSHSARETDAPSDICPKCKKPLDDHQGYMGAGPLCEEALR